LGIVGESGSGKSTLAGLLMGLDTPDGGDVTALGQAWSDLPERQRRLHRGKIQLVDQNPYDALDPRWSVAKTLDEALAAEDPGARRTQRRQRRRQLLEQVGLAERVENRRPDQLSGGQRQRVAIARALARAPEIIICDEPVSSLDAPIQAQILRLLSQLQEQIGLTTVLISHDLAVIAQHCDRVVVMHEGRIVEQGPIDEILDAPAHPFTRELLDAARTIVS